MELRHLRYFVAVAEELSFTKAAQKLRLAQPSLTRQVRNLEEEIGVRLLDRSHNRVTLTSEGRLFLFDSKKLLALAAASVNAVRQLHTDSAQLNIGYVANVHFGLLPATLGAFRKLCPRVALNLFDMCGGEQLEALESHKIDLGFVGLNPAASAQGLLTACIARDTMVAALPGHHPLARLRKIPLTSLSSQFFIEMSPRTHPGALDWLFDLCRAEGFSPKILQEADGEPNVLRFVAGGLGVALLPAQAAHLPHEGVVFRPLSPPLHRESTVAWRADNPSRPLKDYMKIIQDFSRQSTA